MRLEPCLLEPRIVEIHWRDVAAIRARDPHLSDGSGLNLPTTKWLKNALASLVGAANDSGLYAIAASSLPVVVERVAYILPRAESTGVEPMPHGLLGAVANETHCAIVFETCFDECMRNGQVDSTAIGFGKTSVRQSHQQPINVVQGVPRQIQRAAGTQSFYQSNPWHATCGVS